MMRIITTALLAIAAIITACSTRQQVSPSSQRHTRPATTTASRTIAYNPDNLTRADVASAIADVFAARGYKSALGRQTGFQVGIRGTITPFEEGPVRYVTTEYQPPLQGSNSGKWYYRAIIEDRSVELQVFVECTPFKLGPVTIESELTSWDPPDTEVVLQDVQKRLQRH